MTLKDYLRKKLLRRSILRYYERMPWEERTKEWEEVVEWLRHHRVTVFPYPFTERYDPAGVELHYDEEEGLFYTLYRGHRLYFHEGRDARRARRYFNSIFMEQDPASPHRYLSEDFDVEEGDVVVDIGAAEGNFALDVVERAGHVWLFEAGEQWQRPLQLTFAPWRDKVTVVPKRVGAGSGEGQVTLDEFFRDREEKIGFLKIDVDGAEQEVFDGMQELLKGQRIRRIALCTYHRQGDADHFARLLGDLGYRISFSPGYMIFRKRIEPPYLRRGVLKAVLP